MEFAAPIGGQIFSEILPYLEVNQGNQDEVEVINQVETPDIIGKTIKEDAALDCDKENTIIKNQTPKAGITINEGTKLYVEI